MSGIIAVVPRAGPAPPDPLLRRMLERMGNRGEVTSLRRASGATLAACRQAWESDPAAPDPAPRARGRRPTVVADASLYHRADLVKRLRSAGVPVAGDASASGLIAAAHRSWGDDAPEHLEGDFAYALWDPATHTLVCARDFVGRRPLFFAVLPGAVVVASSIGAVLEYPGCPGELDPASIAAAAAGLFGAHTETAYRAVSVIPPGHTLVVREGSVRLLRHWEPPPVESRPQVPGVTLREGSEQLRALLVDAVRERLDPTLPTAVWLSGGWDSTAVFGAGMAAVSEPMHRRHPLRPVSISYPPGDPGREDEWIAATAQRWKVPVHWLRSAEIPFFDRPAERAAARDEPFGHTYESWNRALARGSREVGARIALDGVGGDQLFQLSYVNLADLLRRGRWLALGAEWKAKGLRGRRSFWQWAILPILPEGVRWAAGGVLGAEVTRSYLERTAPPWMNQEFLRRHGVLERERRHTPPRAGLSPAAYETYWYLTHPYAGRILSTVSTLALDEGVQMRSPLLDGRVVEFACSRPWTERSWGAETKRLLRAAVAELVPEEVLAPRPARTGVTSGFLEEGFRRTHAAFVAETLTDPVLARLGMVDASTLRRALDLYWRHGDENLAIGLNLTLQTELWMRGRMASAAGIVF